MVRAKNPDVDITVIAHSFGTSAVSRILLDEKDRSFHRVILCGSIIPSSYDWEIVKPRLTAQKAQVVNDYGTRDVYPVLAKCLSWGYGDTGRHGFNQYGVDDRGHNFRHSDFFDEEFVRQFWKPLIESDTLVPSEWEENAPSPSWILGILSVLPIQWMICGVAAVAAYLLAMAVFAK